MGNQTHQPLVHQNLYSKTDSYLIINQTMNPKTNFQQMQTTSIPSTKIKAYVCLERVKITWNRKLSEQILCKHHRYRLLLRSRFLKDVWRTQDFFFLSLSRFGSGLWEDPSRVTTRLLGSNLVVTRQNSMNVGWID